MAAYGISTELSIPYEEALEAIREALKAQGFGVLTEIDVKETLKQKLGVEFRKYVILGACNPPLAYRALQAETDIGLLLPCNVIVYEKDGGSVVSAMDPQMALGIVENPALATVAQEVAAKLRSAIETVKGKSR